LVSSWKPECAEGDAHQGDFTLPLNSSEIRLGSVSILSTKRVPVAHCFAPAAQKKRFCCVCRKQTEGSTALRCEGKQFIKVFDGNDAVKRGFFRLVPSCRGTKNEEVEVALRAFYLPDEPHHFELEEFNGLQHQQSDDFLNRNASSPDNRNSPKDGGDARLLRAKPRHDDVIKVHAAWTRSSAASVCVSETSTAASVLSEVLLHLDRQGEDMSNFSLQEVCMSSKQGKASIMEQLHQLKPGQTMMCVLLFQLSLRQMNQTRFYVVENRNPTVQVSLLIVGLPPLTKEEHTRLMEEHLDIKSAVALQISCFSEAERIYMLAKDTSINNKMLTSLVIPEIQVTVPGVAMSLKRHKKLGDDVSPLLVFVNPKSGGLKGRELLYSFRKLLNPHQVFDITNGGPLAGFRVLVCGGDGTVGWVLGVLETVRHKLVCREPPIAIVPLGTGNDLARILRWGAGYSGEDPHHILASVDEAEEVQMDRWTILLDAQDISEDGKDNCFLEPPKIVQMSNYFGLGIDAELSLDFHLAREDEPDKFTSRFHNKGVYVKVGLQKISHGRSLHKELQLQVDTKEVPLPNIEGLIFLNIPSWGSGADLWGSEADVRFVRPRIDDSLLEVVGVTGVVHMGQVQSGLRSGIRIAQGSYIRLTVSKPVPVQLDGEPWIQPPGHIIISAAGPK
ncbi:hypothetical protein GOODEAATRI_010120, partial [Goodea atripinnis]